MTDYVSQYLTRPREGLIYSIIPLDGSCRRISAGSASGLVEAVAEYYALKIEDIRCDETEDGDMLAFLQGPAIGIVTTR